jgi:hypothetical protein
VAALLNELCTSGKLNQILTAECTLKQQYEHLSDNLRTKNNYKYVLPDIYNQRITYHSNAKQLKRETNIKLATK